VLVEYVPTFSPGLNYLCAHYYNNPRQCTAAIADMPLVVKLLLLGEGIFGKVYKRREQTETERPIVALLLHGVAYYAAWTNSTDLFLCWH